MKLRRIGGRVSDRRCLNATLHAEQEIDGGDRQRLWLVQTAGRWVDWFHSYLQCLNGFLNEQTYLDTYCLCWLWLENSTLIWVGFIEGFGYSTKVTTWTFQSKRVYYSLKNVKCSINQRGTVQSEWAGPNQRWKKESSDNCCKLCLFDLVCNPVCKCHIFFYPWSLEKRKQSF